MSWLERFRKSREGNVTQTELKSAAVIVGTALIRKHLSDPKSVRNTTLRFLDSKPLANGKGYEPLPFVIRPINYDIAPVEQAKYHRRELRTIKGVEYYFYFMAPDTVINSADVTQQLDTALAKVREGELIERSSPYGPGYTTVPLGTGDE